MKRHTGIDFEKYVANYYYNKVVNCGKESKEFALTLPDVRRLLGARFCAYTKLPLTHPNVGTTSGPRYSDVTIDCVDNKKGYVKGNVKAVAKGINELKAIAQNPTNELSLKHLRNMSVVLHKILKD